MSKEIVIKCEKENYKPGEKISAQVLWFCSKIPKHIQLELVWSTCGRGTTDTGVVHSQQISCSEAKGAVNVEFNIPLDCPLSYKGRLVSINWSLKARADISWALDPKTSQDIVISNI
ncbi:MAG: hypothetical protein HRT88_06150 [Lentisphaeraceae bacterium]|nr:hypothetical protein [Lentisphaeraceae bacterium]